MLQSRPKLRTRRTVEYASSEHDTIDGDEGVDDEATDDDDEEDDSENVEEAKLSTAPAAKKRKRAQQTANDEEYEPQTEEQVGCIRIRLACKTT